MKDLRIEGTTFSSRHEDNRSYLDLHLSAEDLSFRDAQALHDHVKGFPDSVKAETLWRGKPVLEVIEKLKEENDSLKDELESLRKAKPASVDTVERSLFDAAVKQRDEHSKEVESLTKKIAELQKATKSEPTMQLGTAGTSLTVEQKLSDNYDPDKSSLREHVEQIVTAKMFPLTTKTVAFSENSAKAPVFGGAAGTVVVRDDFDENTEIPSEEENFRTNVMRKLAEIKVPKEDARRAVVDAYYELKADATRLKQQAWLGSQLKLTLADLEDVEPELAGQLISAQIDADKAKAAAAKEAETPKSDQSKFMAALEAEKKTSKSPKQKLLAAAIHAVSSNGQVSKAAAMEQLRAVRDQLPTDAIKDLDAMLVVGQDKQTMADKLFAITVTALKLKSVP